jgi:hypothetical protein
MSLHTLLSPGGATEVKQNEIIAALDSVGLDAATLAALETVTASISNLPSDFPDAAAATLLTTIRDSLQGTLDVNVISSGSTTVTGTVGLDAATLSALETINAVVSGTVDLGATTLAALESVQTTVSNFPTDFPDSAAQTLLTEIKNVVEGTLTISGSVDVNNWPAEFPDGHTQPLTDEQLRDSPVDIADSGEREYTHVVATVTDSGNTTIYTPAAGKAIRLHWVYAINKPTSDVSPLIKVFLGSTEIYRVWALSKRQVTTGIVDAPLIVNLSEGANVAVTVLLEEI